MIRDHLDRGRSNEPMNPCPERIHRFIWSTIWFPCEMSAEIPYWWHSSASVWVYLVMPHGKFASTNQRHHLDLRLFTVPYFSIKPSRSSAMHYVWPSLVSYELMGGHQGLFSRWREMSHPPSTFDTHHQARLSAYETKIVAHDAKHSISQKK